MTEAHAHAELAEAANEYERRREAVEEIGAEEATAVVDARRDLLDLLKRYEGTATGTGDFQAFIRFQEELTELVDDLPDDLPRRDAFERVESDLDKRRVSESDFERARRTLEPATEVAETVEARDDALARYREARKAAVRRRRAVEERLDEMDRLRELGDAYLAVADEGDPTELIAAIRDPVAAYDEAVADAFAEMKAEEPARDVLAFVAEVDSAFVDYERPPADLRDYLESSDVGDHPIPKLLSYADYSPSKLEHYVDEPTALKRHVATHRTYLERLDAGPLTLDWPPRPPVELRYRADELISAVDAFAPVEAVARLRTVRDLTRDEAWFARLADAARARERLGSDELERLASGELAEERAAVRDERDALDAALAEHPER